MSSPFSRIGALCIASTIALAGCGGSSSNGSSGGNGGSGGESATTVTYTFTNTAPSAVATQIGTGPFTAATLESGKLTLSIPSGTSNYAVAFVCAEVPNNINSVNEESIVQRSIVDGTSFTDACPGSSSATAGTSSVEIDASAIPGVSYVALLSGGPFFPIPWSGGPVTVSIVQAAGKADVFAVALDSTGQYPLAVRVLRAQTIPGPLNGGNTVVFTANDETTKQTLAYNNLPSGQPLDEVLQTTFYTAGGGALQLQQTYSGPLVTQYPALPAGAVQAGDFYTFIVNVNSGPSDGSAGVELATSTGGPQTFTLPAPWTYSGPSAAVLPAFDFNYSGFSGPQPVVYSTFLSWVEGVTLNNPLGTSSSFIEDYATGNYESSAAAAITLPDLSGIPGFLELPANANVQWTAEIFQGAGFDTNPPSGTVQTVSNGGSFVVP